MVNNNFQFIQDEKIIKKAIFIYYLPERFRIMQECKRISKK